MRRKSGERLNDECGFQQLIMRVALLWYGRCFGGMRAGDLIQVRESSKKKRRIAFDFVKTTALPLRLCIMEKLHLPTGQMSKTFIKIILK